MTYKVKNMIKIFLIAILPISTALYFINTPNSSSPVVTLNDKVVFFRPLIDKYAQAGGDTNFLLELIQDPRSEFIEKATNVSISTVSKKPDYSHFYNNTSITSTRNFLDENKAIFDSAEAHYKVPREVVAAIIWIETRNGSYLGRTHIPSVFLSAAMADLPRYVEANIARFKKNFTLESQKDLEIQVVEKAARKARRGLDELLALEKIEKTTPIVTANLTGSYAGAFGMPQFLPSSYVTWAVDGNGDATIDLFTVEDAIFSAANYLKSNG